MSEFKGNNGRVSFINVELLEMLKKAVDTMRLNTQEEIDLWKSAKKLIQKATK